MIDDRPPALIDDELVFPLSDTGNAEFFEQEADHRLAFDELLDIVAPSPEVSDARQSEETRAKGSWSIILDVSTTDPETGISTRKQKWHTHRGTRKEAETKLTDLLKDVTDGTYVDPSTLTLGEWLRQWLAASKVHWRATTHTRYSGIIEDALAPTPLGKMRVQEIRATHVEAYYAAATVSPSTLTLHRAILQQALKKAKRDGLVRANVALDADKPKTAKHKSDDVQRHSWTAGEARSFLTAAHARGIQPAAFYTLALDSGARKGELCGLCWDHLDLDAGKMQIVQQLLKPGPEPVFGPPKTGKPRTVSLSSATIALLRRHRQHQNELKMANRTTYRNHGGVGSCSRRSMPNCSDARPRWVTRCSPTTSASASSRS